MEEARAVPLGRAASDAVHVRLGGPTTLIND